MLLYHLTRCQVDKAFENIFNILFYSLMGILILSQTGTLYEKSYPFPMHDVFSHAMIILFEFL